MENKIKKLLRILHLIEAVIIRLVSIAGWLSILIYIIKGML